MDATRHELVDLLEYSKEDVVRMPVNPVCFGMVSPVVSHHVRALMGL